MAQTQPEAYLVSSNWDSIEGVQKFSHEAMATTFEIFTLHSDSRYTEQAAWAAFDELDRLEAELSRFVENSDISQINNLTTNQSLTVGPDTFECLELCIRLYAETKGAFDITIGYLMDCWLDEGKTLRNPSDEQLDSARRCTGMGLLELDGAAVAVRLLGEAVKIDLGGVGKGYAVDKMAELLSEWGVDTALIHAGYSSVLALGSPPHAKGWPVTMSNPADRRQTLALLYLCDRALGGSGLQKGRHIIDPRAARPVDDNLAAWACAGDAATADALSTAFMVMSADEVKQHCLGHSDTLAMVITEGQDTGDGKGKILRYGPWEQYS
ncbi:MAG: FAD:protein FMN transferase [Planctomycetota bacterium]|nr:MAG: FAD:protein FMN transferase [Planctomycetota bacterium]